MNIAFLQKEMTDETFESRLQRDVSYTKSSARRFSFLLGLALAVWLAGLLFGSATLVYLGLTRSDDFARAFAKVTSSMTANPQLMLGLIFMIGMIVLAGLIGILAMMQRSSVRRRRLDLKIEYANELQNIAAQAALREKGSRLAS